MDPANPGMSDPDPVDRRHIVTSVVGLQDGMIDNWDMFEKVLDYSYKRIIQSESEFHPVLFSESPWNKKVP